MINAPPGECSWLRPDLSLAVAGFVDASCLQLQIRAGSWETSATVESPFCPDQATWGSDAYDYGQPKTDIFNWACWVYRLMTDDRNPLLPPGKHQIEVSQHEMRAREEAVRKGWFKHWPILSNDQFGPCLIKAWKGEYDSAGDAFQDVRAILKACGRVFAEDEEDELVGFDWATEFGPVKQQMA
jgi:hypothetical protein